MRSERTKGKDKGPYSPLLTSAKEMTYVHCLIDWVKKVRTPVIIDNAFGRVKGTSFRSCCHTFNYYKWKHISPKYVHATQTLYSPCTSWSCNFLSLSLYGRSVPMVPQNSFLGKQLRGFKKKKSSEKINNVGVWFPVTLG